MPCTNPHCPYSTCRAALEPTLPSRPIAGAYRHYYETVQFSYTTSYWFKNALTTADKRDINDALADAEALLGALQAKFAELTS